MSDELPESGEAPPGEPVSAPPPRKRRWKWPAIVFGMVVVLPLVVFALWTWFSLSYSYSNGDRAGYVQKFSEKGWVCKTWEGELSMVNIPGAAQERWQFSVRDDKVAREIMNQMGNRVALTYEEHRGVPSSCFGETDYFVTGVRHVAP
jgi:hypothetical protein